MNNEFKQIKSGNEVRYVLEDGATVTTGDVATLEKPLGELQRRAEPPKPRNFVAKNAKMGGAGQHKDKKKAEKQGDVKHKKPFMENSHPDEKEDKALIRQMVKRDALKKENYGMGGYETAMGSKIQPGQGPNMESDGDAEQELGMAGSELYGIAKHAKELLALIHQQGQEHGLEAWQQSKITKAADYLTAVLQSLDYDTNVEQGVAEGLNEFAPPERGDGQENRFNFLEEFESDDGEYLIELYRNVQSRSFAVSFHRNNMQYVMYPIDGIDAGDLSDGAARYVQEIKKNAAHGSQEDFVAMGSTDLEDFIPPEQGVAEGLHPMVINDVKKLATLNPVDRYSAYGNIRDYFKTDPALSKMASDLMGGYYEADMLRSKYKTDAAKAKYAELEPMNQAFIKQALGQEQGVAEAAKHGLYYNVNKRKKAGTSRPASSPKAPTAQAWKDAAKTAKKESIAESEGRCMQCGMKDCKCPGTSCKCKPIAGWVPGKGFKKAMDEAANAAQRAAIAIAKKKKQGVKEEWSKKYKSSINCSHPKGFSQKAHCAGKKKHTESMMTMEATCPDCGMCQTHGDLNEIKKGAKDSNGFTKCWPGHHAAGTKKGKNGGQVRNCVPNESIAEDPYFTMLERSVSQAQHNLMVGVAHNPQFAQKVKVKQSVGQEFAQADQGHDIKALPIRVPKKK